MVLLLYANPKRRWNSSSVAHHLFRGLLQRLPRTLFFIQVLVAVEPSTRIVEAKTTFIANHRFINNRVSPNTCSRSKSSAIASPRLARSTSKRVHFRLRSKAKPEEEEQADDASDGDDNDKDHYSAKSSQQQQPEQNDSRSLEEKMDHFLNQQFFTPSKVDQNSSPLLKWFANLVERDYETAEALYASLIIVLLVIVSQELLRIQISGGLEHYVPFTRISGSGVGTGGVGATRNGLW
jgi:hypothetical protein